MSATYILPLKAICNLSVSVVFRFRGPFALGAIPPQTRMITGFFTFFKNLPEQHRFNLTFTKDGLRASGSNGTCIVTASGDSKSAGNASLLLPAKSLDKLARMCGDEDEFRVGTTGKTVAFMREDFIYSARLMEGEYIDTETLTASVQPQFQVLTDVPDLRKGLNTVISFDPDGKVGLLFDGQRLTFQCRSKLGSSTASIGVIPLRGSARGEHWFLTSSLEACFHALTGSVKLGVAAGGMLVLETEDALYLQTATRAPVIQAEEKKKAPAKKAA